MDEATANRIKLRSQYESRLDAALLELDEAARAIATSHEMGGYYLVLARAILGALSSKAAIRDGLYDAAQKRARRQRDGDGA
jgi:hypothetical protein